MKEPYIEGVATRDGPESSVVAREGEGEARTGVRAGRVLTCSGAHWSSFGERMEGLWSLPKFVVKKNAESDLRTHGEACPRHRA